MDPATIIGVVGGFAVLIGAIIYEGASISQFINVLATMVVIGGSVTVVLARYTLSSFTQGLLGGLKQTVAYKHIKLTDLIDQVTEVAEVARKQGPLGLEKLDIVDPFLRRAAQMIADGYSAESIRHVLERERDLEYERLIEAQVLWNKIGEAGPGLGMVGTIIGLVAMFSHMDDPKKIGPGMAIALLTTLYGAVLANVVALPIADKLSNRAAQLATNQSMVIDAAVMIRENKGPKQVYEELLSYLPLHKRKDESDNDGPTKTSIKAVA
jgi:chemotaxis protein MotA